MKSKYLVIFLFIVLFACKKEDDKNSITDFDGNVYHSVVIGDQEWLVENLKTTRYNDGSQIQLITDNAVWGNLTAGGAYCWHNNDESNKDKFGALYNFYAINTGKLAPAGWHVATREEWAHLLDYLSANNYGYEGSGDDIAKSLASTSGWTVSSTPGDSGNDQASNNKSGFSALPGSYRWNNGFVNRIGEIGIWWSSTESSSENAYYIMLSYQNDQPTLLYDCEKWAGYSIRCVKD